MFVNMILKDLWQRSKNQPAWGWGLGPGRSGFTKNDVMILTQRLSWVFFLFMLRVRAKASSGGCFFLLLVHSFYPPLVSSPQTPHTTHTPTEVFLCLTCM